VIGFDLETRGKGATNSATPTLYLPIIYQMPGYLNNLLNALNTLEEYAYFLSIHIIFKNSKIIFVEILDMFDFTLEGWTT
jgi:hypothetical protein